MDQQRKEKLNILVVSQYFWPENFRINDLVQEFLSAGHEVTVLTGKPNYPTGTFFPEYLSNPQNYSEFKGAKVIRVPMFPRGKGGFSLILNYFSYFISASIFGIFKLRGQKFDGVFVFQGSPVTVGIPGVILGKLKKAPVILWVLDLWPDTLLAVGAIKKGFIYKSVRKLVSFIFNRCDLVLGQSRQFLVGINQYCEGSNKIKYFPSWPEDLFSNDHVVVAEQIEKIDADFKILFAGNIGEAQDFSSVLKAAELLKDNSQIQFVVVGDGRAMDWVKSEVTAIGLSNVHLLGRFPLESMPSFYLGADAFLVSLRSDPVFGMTIPGKIQSYMCAGKPILSMLDGEGSRVIKEAETGLVADSGDYKVLAQNILTMSSMSKSERGRMGLNGKNYAEREFNRLALFKKLEGWFISLSSRSI